MSYPLDNMSVNNDPHTNQSVEPTSAPAAPVPPAPVVTRLRVTTYIRDKIFAILFLMFSIMWVDFGLFGGFDLGHSIAFGGLAVLTCIYSATANHPSLMGTFYAACAIAVTVAFALYTTPQAKTMLFFWSIILMVMSVLSNSRHGRRGWKHIGDIFSFIFVTPFERSGAMFGSLLASDDENSSAKKKLGSVLIGIACAVPALFIIVPLLSASDAAFEALLGNIFIDSLPRIFGSVILGSGLFILLFSAVFAAIKHIITVRVAGVQETAPTDKAARGINGTGIAAFLSAISLVYVVYLLSQFAYFFNAFSGLLPEGFTEAEYARRGFFEMTVVCSINIAVIALTYILCRKNEKGIAPLSVRLLCLFICLFSLVIVATVIGKLVIYMSRFGLTELRVYTTLFCIAAAIVIICVGIRLFARRFAYFRVAAGLLATLSVIIAFADVNTTIARYNTEAYIDDRLEQIDVDYLSELGDSAMPYMVRLVYSKDETVAKNAAQKVRNYAYHYGTLKSTESEFKSDNGVYESQGVKHTFEPNKETDFREFNLQRQRAVTALDDDGLWRRIAELTGRSYL